MNEIKYMKADIIALDQFESFKHRVPESRWPEFKKGLKIHQRRHQEMLESSNSPWSPELSKSPWEIVEDLELNDKK